MNNLRLNYETLIKITRSLTKSKNTEKVIQMTVDSIRSSLDIKGCALYLINHSSNELEVAASSGLSKDYLNKGGISVKKSISDSLEEDPVGVNDVSDDPRIQYPEAAKAEGIVRQENRDGQDTRSINRTQRERGASQAIHKRQRQQHPAHQKMADRGQS